MFGKDKKIFMVGLIASSFALMTTLKAQNYSYESSPQPYVRAAGGAGSAKVEVMPLPSKKSSSDVMDLSSIYSKGVSVSYTNDRYPISEISTKRKVMRIARSPSYFRDSAASQDWTVRIGEEEVQPLGFIKDEDIRRETLNQARRSQYGDLRADEMMVGSRNDIRGGSVSTNEGNYIRPEYAVVDENEFYADLQEKAQEEYNDIRVISKRIKEQRPYPWVQTGTARGAIAGNDSGAERYAEAYRNEKPQNPWADEVKISPMPEHHNVARLGAEGTYTVSSRDDYEGVRNVRIERKDSLQRRQQALLLPEVDRSASGYRSFQKVSASQVAPSYYQDDDDALFDELAYGTSNDRVENREAVSVAPPVRSTRLTAEAPSRPLLVPIADDNEVASASNARMPANSGIIAEYDVNVVPVQPITTAIDAVKPNNNISLTELKINFKPFKSDISVKTVRWLKEFSRKAAVDFGNIVEIRISPNMPHVQNERLLMLKGILNSNGVYDQQIRVIANRKSADSVIIKVINNEEDDEASEVVDYKDLSGSYYYYY